MRPITEGKNGYSRLWKASFGAEPSTDARCADHVLIAAAVARTGSMESAQIDGLNRPAPA
ncbi:MAG: hypothetical protein RL648_1760 [Verrucomicrobiota bacterium]|jgi:hypothetical protein